MKKYASILLLALALSFSLAQSRAEAQYIDLNQITPLIGENLPDLGFEVLRGSANDGVCEGFIKTYGITFPTGTGSEAIDKAMADDAAAKLAEINALNLADDKDGCRPPENPGDAGVETTVSFTATSPSPDILSVLKTDFYSNLYAAHPSTGISAETYRISTGGTLALADIFQDVPASMPKLWTKLVADWCDLYDSEKVPSFYVSDDIDCPAPSAAMPDSFKAANPPLSAIGHVLLTPEGMTLNLGEYGGQSRADGNPDLEIPKDFLIGIGAKPEIWR